MAWMEHAEAYNGLEGSLNDLKIYFTIQLAGHITILLI